VPTIPEQIGALTKMNDTIGLPPLAAESDTQPVRLSADERAPTWNAFEYQHLFPTLKSRWEITKFVRPGGVGIELGVATGIFSDVLLRTSSLSYLYGVDSYGDRKHTVEKYQAALARLAPHRARNSILRMRFDEALPLFPDQYFDFIYVDGCAGNGEEGGKTFYDWWPKLKSGGVFAGHDYSPDWPLVIKATDRFVAKTGVRLFTVGGGDDPMDVANRYASWFTVRP
jgi:hypothetical protein